MFTNKKSTVFCRCGECGQNIIKTDLSVFSLSGGEVHERCGICGKGVLTISLIKGNTVHLEVPCVFCRGVHKYNISAPSFFDKDVTILSCAMSGYDSCIVGNDPKALEGAIEKAEEELEALIANQNGGSDGEGEMPHEEIVRISTNVADIMALCNAYLTEGKYRCNCQKRPEVTDLTMQIEGSVVELSCKKCGALISLDGFFDEDIDDLDAAGEIVLE